MLMASHFINESRSETKIKHFDWWGATTLGIALSALVLVLDKGPDWNWISVNSVIAYAVIVVFTYIFIRIEKNSPEPIVDLKFFKIPAFVNTLVNNFIVFMGMFGGIFLIPVFAQTFLGYNATQSGYLFIPMAVALMLGAPLGGFLTGRVESRYVIFASTLVAGIGIFFFSFLDPKSGPLAIMIPLSVMAFGLGFGMAQRTNVIASVVDQEEIGVASSVLALVRNLSGAFGIALFATILTVRTKSNILLINGLSTLTSHLPADVQKYIGLVILKAQIAAYDYVFILASILVIVGAFAILTLKIKNERTDIKVHVE
jgi:DHA2 family multidrug resistance protein